MAITQNLRKFARKFKGFHPEAHFDVFLDAIGAEKLVVCDEDDPWGPTITRYCKLLCGFVIRAGLVQNKLHKKTKNGFVINKETFTAEAMNFVLVLLEPMLYVKPKAIDVEKIAGIPFIQALDKEPLNDNAARVMLAASKSYHGGYNGCSEVGYFETEIPTKDYDLKAAYPTAMTLVPDVDWFDCLEYVVEEFDLDEVADALFTNATPIPFVIASIDSFEFPETVQFCCLPVVVEGIPIYPRKYDCKDESCVDVPGVYATGPELYLAHKLGAKVRVRVAYVLNAKYKVVNDEIV